MSGPSVDRAGEWFTSGTDSEKVVATAGVPVQLVASPQSCAGVYVVAKSTNLGLIAVGFSNQVSANAAGEKGLALLAAREWRFVPAGDAAAVWIDASLSGEGVAFSIVAY